MAFISSVVPSPMLSTDLLLDPADTDFPRTGLRVRSAIYLHRLVTLAARVVIRDLGDLPPRQLRAVDERLRRLFAL
jgi:mRNA interferase MazF